MSLHGSRLPHFSMDIAILSCSRDLVAGNKGTLNKQQMAGCLYLMDNAKKGIKPPQKLPPGPFPPVVRYVLCLGMQLQVNGLAGAVLQWMSSRFHCWQAMCVYRILIRNA